MAVDPSAQPVVVDSEVAVDAASPSSVTPDANAAAKSSDASNEVVAVSDAPDANKPKSMLEAVQAAIKSDSEKGDPSTPDSQEKPKDGEADVAADPAKTKDGEDEPPPPFHEHPAWQRQLAKVRDRDATIAALTPKAEQFEKIVTFAQEAGLADKEIDAGFNIMRMMKKSPAEALKALSPYVDALRAAVGETLPKDLQDKVNLGHISKQDAQELARHRAAQANSAATQEQAAQNAAADLAVAMQKSVAAWEGDWAKTDPDYSRKATPVRDRLVAKIHLEGMPKTSDAMVALAQKARGEIEAEFKAFLPKPVAIKADPAPGTARVVNKAPTTMLEAVKAGIAAAA